MASDEQKRTERAFLELAFQKLGIPVSSVEDHEAPDFAIVVDGRRVGVEVTEARTQDVAWGVSALRRFKRELMTRLSKEGISIFADMSMYEGVAVLLAQDAAMRTAWLERIAQLCSWTFSTGKDISYDAEDLKRFGLEGLDALRLHMHDAPGAGVNRSSWGEPRRIIQEAIDRKAEKLPQYRQEFDQVWLLVVGSAGNGGTLDRSDFEWHSYRSPFDRTLGYEAFEKIATELRIENSGESEP